jgi:D-alanine--D-alanine ligase
MEYVIIFFCRDRFWKTSENLNFAIISGVEIFWYTIITGTIMKICVLQVDYSTSGVDYQNYDPPRDLSILIPEQEVDTVFLNKLTVYKQLNALRKKAYDVFVNLCEGYLEWEVPSIDVVYTLELLKLPYTGPSTILYDPSKELMKYVAYCASVKTPAYMLVENSNSAAEVCESLKFPLFVKPAKAGDSLGIDEKSLVQSKSALEEKLAFIIQEYDEILVEEYIDGREFTVLVAANNDGRTCTTFQPVEFIFPAGKKFKTYTLKTSELLTDANIAVTDKTLAAQLQDSAQRIFKAFGGVGYARLDFRMNATGELYFLEINFTCSIFYQDIYKGSADYVLKFDGIGQRGFLLHIIGEGIARHQRQKKKYAVKGKSLVGYGIYATTDMNQGDVIFKGEEKAQTIVTKKFVDDNWDDVDKKDFCRFAYPISKEVFILWDADRAECAPQNHSCDANTGYVGLNVVALRSIKKGEELTLDYGTFCDENSESFTCQCGSLKCRKIITGKLTNTIH